jgi:septal ring factor EnvC (AmiA/AmiB activator)
LKKQQDELDQQRRDMEAQQRQQREQQEEQQRQQRERDAQYQRDQEELARLRAQAAAPTPVIATAPASIEPKAEVAPVSSQATSAEQDDLTTTAPAVDDIVEVVALGFDVDLETSRAWLRAIRF